MTGKQLALTIIVLLLLAGVVATVFYIRFQDGGDPFADGTTPAFDENGDAGEPAGEDETPRIPTTEPLTVVHTYSNGTHNYGGSIVAPTPCHNLEADALIAESFPEQITIQLTLEAPAPDVVCTQVTDRKFFDLSVTASEQAQLVRVTLNGETIPFEIFEESKG